MLGEVHKIDIPFTMKNQDEDKIQIRINGQNSEKRSILVPMEQREKLIEKLREVEE